MSPQNNLSPEERQKALLEIPEADLNKIRSINEQKEAIKVDDEWIILAEFGMKFGWEAYKDARDDKICSAEMAMLLAASRKIDNRDLYRNAQASYIGCGSSQSTNPADTFKSLTDKLINEMKADE